MDEQKGRTVNDLTVMLMIVLAFGLCILFILYKLSDLHKKEMAQKSKEQP